MATIYKMRKHLFSFGQDFTIETMDGNPAFMVDGQAMSLRDTFTLADAGGSPVYRAQRKTFQSAMRIESDSGVVAEVHKKFALFAERFRIDLADGSVLDVSDSITNHEYRIARGGTLIASVSQRWFSIPQTFGIEIDDGEDAALLLTITVCIDEMIEREEARERRR